MMAISTRGRPRQIALIAVVLLLMLFSDAEAKKCKVPKVVVTKDVDGVGLAKADIEAIVGKNPNWVDPMTTHFTCTDGIFQGDALSTPGGDFGEFLMGLSLFEQVMKKYYPDYVMDRSHVQELFSEFMNGITPERAFYMHMDARTMDNLNKALTPILGPNPWIGRVEEGKQSEVLSLLTKPEYIGCAHLKAIVQDPSKYKIPGYVTVYFLEAFYNFMWNHENSTKLVLQVTDAVPADGSRTEGAYVKITTNQEALDITDECLNDAPVISAKSSRGTVLVAHPQFVAGIRDSIVFYFSRKLQTQIGESEVSDVTIGPQMANLAATHLQLSISNLAKGKPVYTAVVVMDNTSNTTRMAIALVVSLIVLVALFGGILWIKLRQLKQFEEARHYV